MKKKVVGIILAAILMVVMLTIPCPEGLSYEGKMAWACMLAGIILWVCESIPLGLAALTIMCMMPYLGVVPFSEAFSNFISSTIFFLIGVFGITVAMSHCTIPKRIVGNLVLKAGKRPRALIFMVMLATAFLSMFMSDIATCGLMLAITLPILEANKCEKGRSGLAKAMMIGIPFAAVIGGVATPCGCATNVMAMNMMESTFGVTVSFVDWLAMGLPLTIIMLPLCWLILVTVFKPEELTDEAFAVVTKEAAEKNPWTAGEKRLLVIVLVEIVLWIASSWVLAINTNAVAIFALAIMMLPKMEIMTWKQYCEGCPWDVILLIGGVQSIAAAIVSTGAAAWLLNAVLSGVVDSMGHSGIIGVSTFLAEIIHLVCPVGPANVGLNLVPMTSIAITAGISPAIMLFLVGCMSAGTWIIPYDCVPVLTYAEGYYSVKDMCKVGWLPMIILIAYMTFIMPPIASMIGL